MAVEDVQTGERSRRDLLIPRRRSHHEEILSREKHGQACLEKLPRQPRLPSHSQ